MISMDETLNKIRGNVTNIITVDTQINPNKEFKISYQ